MSAIYSEIEARIDAATEQKRAAESKKADRISQTEQAITTAEAEMQDAYDAGDVQAYKTAKQKKEDAALLLDMLKTQPERTTPEGEELRVAVFEIQNNYAKNVDSTLQDIVAQLEKIYKDARDVYNTGNKLLQKYAQDVQPYYAKVGPNLQIQQAPYNSTGYAMTNIIESFVNRAKEELARG